MKPLTLWVVIRNTGSNECWECSGGGDHDVELVVAHSGMEAMNLAAARYIRERWDEPFTYHAFPVRETRHKKPRVLARSEWATYSPAYHPVEEVWA